jgi:hypothetical protein
MWGVASERMSAFNTRRAVWPIRADLLADDDAELGVRETETMRSELSAVRVVF